MKKCPIYLLALVAAAMSMSSCRTSAPKLDYRALAHATEELGVEIGPKDNHQLYLEAAEWIGVPYRAGRDDKQGTDCSGLTSRLYKTVYDIKLPRSTEDQLKESAKVRRSNLQEGDLVFFSSRQANKRVAHVGIYLKEGQFIHASTSRGVIVSSLNEEYYKKYWIGGGRIR